ncbi:MAG: SIS domain-containing protein [Phycisphaeraceae bacterium]|nr:SIS domain-containing protein [Phycisphaeraceae bacterium]
MSILQDNIRQAQAVLGDLATLEGPLQKAVRLVAEGLCGGHKLLLAGNGGSASDADHVATEFLVRFNRDRRPYPAIALTESGGTLTATGNDYDFADIFARQVQALGQKGDVLVVFSTSGGSENIVRALKAGKERGLTSIAFLGKQGGKTAGLATVDLIVPGTAVTARIQEAHKLLYHTLCEMVELELPAK